MRAPFLSVFTAQISDDVDVDEVYPPLRNEEILSCKSEKAKREKFCAWKLLEFAFLRAFGRDIREISFRKTENGKWECDFCYFSLSHSHGAVAVALSDSPVGVDIEKISPLHNRKGVAEKVLTQTEKAEYQRLAVCPKQAERWLLELWTKKESLFKTGTFARFVPSAIETGTAFVQTKLLCVDGEDYFLSVATKDEKKALQAIFYENCIYLP